MAEQRDRERLRQERKAHDAFYAERAGSAPRTVNEFRRLYESRLAYPWQQHFNLYSYEAIRFWRAIQAVIQRQPVLEYGCGRGELACYLGLQGLSEVHGFDLSGVGVRVGQQLARQFEIADRVHLQQANAQALPYPDGYFGCIVGHGVLHHIAKYDGTAAELHRVMQQGAKAVFLENLGNGPWRFARRWTLLSKENEQFGDINLTSRFLRVWGRSFRRVTIRGFNLAFMVKRLFFVREEHEDGTVTKRNRFRGPAWALARGVLSLAWLADSSLINWTPLGNWLGGMCLVTFEK